jgi:hypothetical protein
MTAHTRIPWSALLVCMVAVHVAVLAEDDVISFSHKQHIEDVGVGCEDCHADVEGDTIGGARPYAANKEPCAMCHEDNVGGSDEEACALCHSNVSEAVALDMTRLHPEFYHGTHLKAAKGCTDCHADMETAETATDRHTPPMPSCMGCHDDGRAPSSCNVCHKDVSSLKPVSHHSLWMTREGHGVQARFTKSECAACHDEGSCDACHQGQLGIRVHNPNYRYAHQHDARRIDRNCGVCHQVTTYCSTCH